jgi:N-acetylmuramoyl-L-alanine amidase
VLLIVGAVTTLVGLLRHEIRARFGTHETLVAPPKERPDAMAVNKPMFIIVHHTAGDGKPENITFEAVDRYHREQGWDMIGYHYFVAWDGTLTKGRADLQPGAHTKENGLNYMSLGVCLAGNFDQYLPTAAQIRTLRHLLKEKMAEYNIPATSVYPHRKFTDKKSCYGARLSDHWAYSVAITDDLPHVETLTRHESRPVTHRVIGAAGSIPRRANP